MRKLKVAIIGQGRSGRDIHGAFFKKEANDCCEVVAVVEFDPARREQAEREYPGCVSYSDYTELFDRNDIDLVVNSSYSEMHYPVTKDLLMHKFNVLVEKPMARTRYECEDLIKTAKDNGVNLYVFQQSFLAPFYIYAKELIESGKLGKIQEIKLTYGGFARRYDWQTLQYKVAGSTYNTGPHPIGLALGFLDFDEYTRVEYSRLANANSAGDADDYSKIILSAPGKPVIDIEMNACDTYPEKTLKISGHFGTFRSTTTEYEMKYYVEEESPAPKLVVESLKNEEGNPSYCKDSIAFHEEAGAFPGDAFNTAVNTFYHAVQKNILMGEPMPVTAEMAAKVVGVIEAVHAANPLPVLY